MGRDVRGVSRGDVTYVQASWGDVTLRRPPGLNGAGRAAWARADEAVGGEDRFYDACARYAYAVDLAHRTRQAWIRHGRLIVENAANGILGKSPYLRAVEEAERDAAQAGKALGLDLASAKQIRIGGKIGRPPGAASAPDRRVPPPVRLRQVEDQA